METGIKELCEHVKDGGRVGGSGTGNGVGMERGYGRGKRQGNELKP